MKFLQSKKGFTLVELMIVVVIMAILVAVAVPIYSAVTENSRKKTCLANQREIVSIITNAQMSDLVKGIEDGDTYRIATNDDATNGTWSKTNGSGTDYSAILTSLYSLQPYCPEKGSYIDVTINTVTVTGTEEKRGITVTTTCKNTAHK